MSFWTTMMMVHQLTGAISTRPASNIGWIVRTDRYGGCTAPIDDLNTFRVNRSEAHSSCYTLRRSSWGCRSADISSHIKFTSPNIEQTHHRYTIHGYHEETQNSGCLCQKRTKNIQKEQPTGLETDYNPPPLLMFALITWVYTSGYKYKRGKVNI